MRFWPMSLGIPLYVAAELGKTDAIPHLVDLGADPSVKDGNGRTVMEWARPESNGSREVFGKQVVKGCWRGKGRMDRNPIFTLDTRMHPKFKLVSPDLRRYLRC